MAPFDSNGTLGDFAAVASTFTLPCYAHASVAYNGYLYVIGGYATSAMTTLADVQVAPFTASGALGGFSTTTPLPAGRRYHAAVAYNGYLYVLGGTNGAPFADVLYAPINANGTLGSFGAAGTFTTARQGLTSVAYNGHLYVIGGDGLNDVQVAAINSDGTVGTFVATSSFVTARTGHSSVAYNGYLYVLGGQSGTSYFSDVQVAAIIPDGTLGAFSPTTSFNTARRGQTSVAADGYLYVAGGSNGGTLGGVEVAPINANGTLGAFRQAAPLSTARFGHTSVTNNGYLYVVGGSGISGDLNTIERAALKPVGTPGAFVATAGIPSARMYHASVAYNGFLYVIGGTNGTSQNDVQVAPLKADGTLGSFSPTSSFSTARWGHAAVATNGYLYVIGGNGVTPLSDVQVAPINPNGTLGTFNPTSSFSTGRYLHAGVAANGYLWVVGGYDGVGYLSDVQAAQFGVNGGLGAFAATTSFPTARYGHSSVAYNGYLYVIGGSSSSPLNDVQVAPISSTGTLGAFSATSSLPFGRFLHSSAAANGFLYVVGGDDGVGYLNDVLAAPINSNGTLGDFTPTTTFTTARRGHASLATNGFLYVIGGYGTVPGFYLGDIQVAPLRVPAARGSYSKVIDFGGPSAASSLTVGDSATKGDIRLEYRTAPASGVFGATVAKGVIPLGAAVPLGGNGLRYLWVRFTLDDTLAAAINPDATNERDLTDFTVAYVPDPALSPTTAAVAPRGPQAFTCSGGTGAPFTFAVSPNSSGASIDSTGAYVAGVVGSVTDTVTCTDSAGAVGRATVSVGAAIIITPSFASVAPRQTKSFTASGGSNSGFTWTFATDGNSSGGSITPGGAYTAGPGSVVLQSSDVLVVTDSLGNTANVVVQVGLGVSIAPPSVTLAPRQAQLLAASGGYGMGFTWSVVTNNSGMTIGAATGLYTAGPTGNVTDEVQVTDPLNNTANRLITVTGGVSVSPLTATVYPKGTLLFTPDGGSNSGFTWTLPSNASGGTIDGGRYLAGATGSVSDIAQATDSLGNTGAATITVTAGVSASPPSANVAPRGSAAFGADGGSGTGYSWTFQTNLSGGAVTPSGAYTAGDAGAVLDVLRVTDSVGNVGLANVTVLPGVTITPASPSTPPSGTVNFSASNGSGTGWAWSLTATGSGSPSINPTSGVYVAGTAQGTDTVKVTDSLGNSATINVNVTNALAITPSFVSLAPRESLAFTGTGGSDAGYAWALQANNSGATLNPATAAYQAGATGSVIDTIRLTDSLSNVATATVNVTAGLSVSPAAPTAAPKSSVAFTASGGKAGAKTWSFQTNASGGTINSTSGAYQAGPVGSVTDVVLATDSVGSTSAASVSVSAAVSISPPTLTVAPREGSPLSATGGSNSGFAWAFVTNASGGTLNAGTGAYRAGNVGLVTDVVQVADPLGNTAQLSVSVTEVVSISPDAGSVPPLGTLQFAAAGGSGAGYSWSIANNRSGGNVIAGSGLYTAGSVANVVDDLRVVDPLGNTAAATVNVTEPLAMLPTLPSVAPRQTLPFFATGGAGTNRWTLSAIGSGGSIGNVSGVYVAGPTGDTTDTVRVSDRFNNVATTVVTVTAPLTLSPNSDSLPPRGTRTFAAQGGLADGGYTFFLSAKPSGGAIDGVTGAYQAGATGAVADIVMVKDAVGATAMATVAVTGGIAISPAKAEVASGASQTFTATGGSGEGFTWSLSGNESGGTMNPATGEYVAGPTGNVTDHVTVKDSYDNEQTALVTVLASSTGSKLPPGEDKPVNGWGCGCQGTSASASGLLGLALLALLLPRRRRALRSFNSNTVVGGLR
jgi:MYXO-CTERM domain-containing protein